MHSLRGRTFWGSAGLTMVSALLLAAPLLNLDPNVLIAGAPATLVVAAVLLAVAAAWSATSAMIGLAVAQAAFGSCAVVTEVLFGTSTPPWLTGLVALLWLVVAFGAWLCKHLQPRQVAEQQLTQQTLPVLIINGEGYIELTNDAFANLVGIERHSLAGEPMNGFLPTELCRELVDSDCTKAGPRQNPVPLSTATGQTCWVLATSTTAPVFGPGAMLVTCWPQAQTQQQLQDQAHKVKHLRSQLAASHDIVLWLSSAGKITLANERAQLVLGKSIVNLDIAACLDETQIAQFEQACKKCLQSDEPVVFKRLQLHPTDRHSAIAVDARLQRNQIGTAALLLTANSVMHFLSAERKLRNSVGLMELAYQESPDAIAVYRLSDHTALQINPGFTALFGYSQEGIVGQSDSLLKLWADPETRIQIQEQLLLDQYHTHMCSVLAREDGTTFDGQLVVRRVDTADQTCVMIIVRDISEQVVSERARVANEKKFHQSFEFSPDGMAILRKQDAVIIDVNPAMVEASGYEKSQLVNRSLFELGVMANLSEMEPSDAKLKEEQHFDDVEMTFQTKSGDRVPALVSARQFELEGEPHIIAVARDVRELRSAQAKVARSEERFRSAFENAQLAMILMDLDGRIFQSNLFAQDLLSYSAADLDGLHISRLIPPEERIDLKESLTRILQEGETRVRSERRMQCQNGLEIWTNFQIVLQRDSQEQNSYFIIQAADVTDIKLSQRRMERMAFYDTLTDLANRRLFQERLQHAIEHCQRSGRLSALLYLDLDQFKRVNDTLGHEAGDVLLREVALRLAECVRTEDTVGRTGGDEFTVLLFDIEKSGDAGVVAEKILSSLREPISVSGHNLVVTTSIGVAIIPNDGRDANVVMKNADLAMYRAKDRGRNNYQFFAEDMNTKAVLRLRTENELREGLTRGEFILHHQPKYRISDGKIIGVECLVRWNHPTRGLLPPSEFIQVAEETGAIVNLGSWIIEAACQAGKRFADIADGEFTTAVNISPRQFRDPKLISHIRRCLRTSGLQPGLLQIEITETMLMHDVEAASTIVARLHELGTFLAIDDFGTGYSSLNYLKKFPIQTVKVDRSFVTDIPHNSDDMAITAAVIAMAHRLNMDVVAEGVETEGQLQFLCENRCEFAQGYLFSKPVTEAELETLIRQRYSPFSGDKLSRGRLSDPTQRRASLEVIGKASREK